MKVNFTLYRLLYVSLGPGSSDERTSIRPGKPAVLTLQSVSNIRLEDICWCPENVPHDSRYMYLQLNLILYVKIFKLLFNNESHLSEMPIILPKYFAHFTCSLLSPRNT